MKKVKAWAIVLKNEEFFNDAPLKFNVLCHGPEGRKKSNGKYDPLTGRFNIYGTKQEALKAIRSWDRSEVEIREVQILL